jgi:hypothetical protein
MVKEVRGKTKNSLPTYKLEFEFEFVSHSPVNSFNLRVEWKIHEQPQRKWIPKRMRMFSHGEFLTF